MRRQDELIALYASQSALARKFLLSQLEEMSGSFDSDELLEILQGQVGDESPAVRYQALYSLSQFLPGFIRKRYSLPSGDRGEPREAPDERFPKLKEAGLFSSTTISESLLNVLGGLKGWNRRRAIQALGHFGLRSIQTLFAAAFKMKPELQIGLALAEMATAQSTPLLHEVVREHGPESPDLYLLLGACPGPGAFDILMDGATRTSIIGRMNLARVLGRLGEAGVGIHGILEAFRKLTEAGEVWVQVAGLASLEKLGAPEALPLVVDLFGRSSQWFLRMEAIRTAGAIGSPDAIELCLKALRDDHPAVCATALDSLMRQKMPRADLEQAALPLLASTHAKAREAAIVASASPDQAPEMPALKELVTSPERICRVEAAYCLGCLLSRKGLELLVGMALTDPSFAVRNQAIKSLSEYPVAAAIPYLIRLIASDDQMVALSAARVIVRYEGQEAKHVAKTIEEVLAEARRPYLRALLYRSLGALIVRSIDRESAKTLELGLEETDPRVLTGVIEGWVLVGGHESPGVPAKLKKIVVAQEPRLRARALLALWHAGTSEAVEILGGMIRSGNEAEFEPALESSLELGLLISEPSLPQRFPALARQLMAATETPDFQTFLEAETMLEPAPDAGPAEPVAPPASFAGAAVESGASTGPGQPARPAALPAPWTDPPVEAPEFNGSPAGSSVEQELAARMREMAGAGSARSGPPASPPLAAGPPQTPGLAGPPEPVPGRAASPPLQLPVDALDVAAGASSCDLTAMQEAYSQMCTELMPDTLGGQLRAPGPQAQPAASAPADDEIPLPPRRTSQPTARPVVDDEIPLPPRRPPRPPDELADELAARTGLDGAPPASDPAQAPGGRRPRAPGDARAPRPSALGRFGPWFGAVWARRWGKAAIVAPLVLLGFWLFFVSDEPPIPDGSPGHLWSYKVDGPCKLNGYGLQLGSVLWGGVQLQCPAKGELVLMTPAENRIVMTGEGRLTYGGVGKTPTARGRYRFGDLAGRILFELGQYEIQLDLKAGRLIGRKATLKIDLGAKGGTVVLVDGEAQLETKGRVTRLTPKQPTPVE